MESERPPYNVVVTGDSLATEAMRLLEGTCRVLFSGPYPDPPKLAQILRQEKAHALILRTGKAPAEVIKASSELKVISKHGAGYDNVDVATATALRIPVMTAATANYQSVAEHTLGLMLSLAKDIPRLDSRIRHGFWDKAQYRGVELFRKTLGLVGFGRIGRRVYELTVPLQMRVLVYDPFLGDRPLPPGVTRLTNLEELLSIADIVSLHCPLTEKTRNLIGKDELGRMKKTAWLINTARGGVVDEEALIAALQEGKIAGAAIDTFRQEPPEDLGRLCEAGKVVLTPHIAAATEEAFTRMGIEAAQNVLTILQGKMPNGDRIVNAEVLPQMK
jgi:D-3-phosphoglycerate dehydrogenase / 2-oxoglutarate reductase